MDNPWNVKLLLPPRQSRGVSPKRRGIRVIDVRHEADAVFATDAVARLSSVPGSLRS